MITSDKDVKEWVEKQLFAAFGPKTQALGLKRHDQMVAGVVYENWNGASVTCHIVIQGLLTPAYLAAIFHYPFIHLGVKKIIAPVAESNEECIRLVTKMGFVREATLSDAHPDGSILLYTMERDQCKFIGERYGERLAVTARAA